MQTTVAALDKRGGRIRFRDCGGRVYIVTNPDQGQGVQVWAAWKDMQTGTPLVISRGIE